MKEGQPDGCRRSCRLQMVYSMYALGYATTVNKSPAENYLYNYC